MDLFKQTAGLIIGVAWHQLYKCLAFGRLASEVFRLVQSLHGGRGNFNRKCFSCEFVNGWVEGVYLFFAFPGCLCLVSAKPLVLWFCHSGLWVISLSLRGSLLPRGSKNRAAGSLRYGKAATGEMTAAIHHCGCKAVPTVNFFFSKDSLLTF